MHSGLRSEHRWQTNASRPCFLPPRNSWVCTVGSELYVARSQGCVESQVLAHYGEAIFAMARAARWPSLPVSSRRLHHSFAQVRHARRMMNGGDAQPVRAAALDAPVHLQADAHDDDVDR